MPFGMGRFVVGVERCDNRRYGHNSRFGGGSANGEAAEKPPVSCFNIQNIEGYYCVYIYI